MQFELPVQRFILSFHAPARRTQPPFAGNAWRGAFGHALRAAACLTGAAQCTGCARTAQCAYAYVFETPPPADATAMRLYPNAPHPFVLRELPSPAGTDAQLMLTVIGRAQRLLPLLIEALRQAAGGPHGIAGQRLELRAVRQESLLGQGDWRRIDGEGGSIAALPAEPWRVPAAPCSGLRLQSITPLRVKKEGRSVTASALGFGDVFGALMRRISMLCSFHGKAALQAPFAELAAQSRQVRVRSQWVTVPQQRFSNRQHQAMPMDGVTGWMEIDAADAAVFWPFLWLGQYVHAGSAATMGLGCYEIVPARFDPLAAQPASLPVMREQPASLPVVPQRA